MYIVTDNARIRKTVDIHKAIHNHRHTTLFLSSYSPFLNPITTINYFFYYCFDFCIGFVVFVLSVQMFY
jgi:transposase